MSPGLPTAADLVAWVRSEYLKQYREGAERIALPLDERLESGETITGLRVAGYEKKNTVLTCTENISKFRVGDVLYPHPEDEAVDLSVAMPKGAPSAKIKVRSPDGLRLEVEGVLDKGITWCLDGLPKPWDPLSAQPAAIAAGFDSAHPIAKRWRRWLSGEATTGPAKSKPVPNLTPRQCEAYHRALQDEVTVIQGPPGTGKTHLIAAILERLVLDGQRVLVTCFSHAAIGNVLRAVLKRNGKIPCVQVGRPGDIPIEGLTEVSSFSGQTAPGVYGMTVFQAVRPWSRPIMKAAVLPDRPADGSPIPAAAYQEAYAAAWDAVALPEPTNFFDVVVIDEASQMSIPQALMALLQGGRCIVVGDHRQLPPVAQIEPRFAPSIFDQLIAAYSGTAVMLDRTFRMNDVICASPSRLFYGDRLKPESAVGKQRIQPPKTITSPSKPNWLVQCLDSDQPVVFVSVPTDTGTDANPEEAAIVGTIAAHWLARGLGTKDDGLAVVCANRRQNLAVKAATETAIAALPAAQRQHAAKDLNGLLCDTVERIQGQERDCILVSLTGSDPEHLSRQWTFSHCPRRFNVSITRPRTKLIVVGSPAFFHFTPHTGDGDSLPRLAGIVALKRWYLDRLDADEVVAVIPGVPA
jgi:DNA replication ATP-dependent helicase Dna2